MLSLVVTLRVRPGLREEFLTAIREQAETSMREEPGCLRFDVCEDVDDPDRFVFYEVYRDDAALDAHRATPHFRVWQQAAERTLVPGSRAATVGRLAVSHARSAD